jgi:hypothetical protein
MTKINITEETQGNITDVKIKDFVEAARWFIDNKATFTMSNTYRYKDIFAFYLICHPNADFVAVKRREATSIDISTVLLHKSDVFIFFMILWIQIRHKSGNNIDKYIIDSMALFITYDTYPNIDKALLTRLSSDFYFMVRSNMEVKRHEYLTNSIKELQSPTRRRIRKFKIFLSNMNPMSMLKFTLKIIAYLIGTGLIIVLTFFLFAVFGKH